MVMQFLRKTGLGLILAMTSAIAHAEYAWNFPKPVTPMALDTLHVHNKFMLITMIVCVVVLGIMIYSIVVHRKSRGYKAANFTGPSTKSQVFWTTVPFAILLYIDFILMGIPAYHSVVMMEEPRVALRWLSRSLASNGAGNMSIWMVMRKVSNSSVI